MNKLVIFLAAIGVISLIQGCSLLREDSQVTDLEKKKYRRSFIPIIYPDKVIEINPQTGDVRTIPDEDLIVEDGKVWGRYLRLGQHIEYIMSYHNRLCAPVHSVNFDELENSSKPVRSFAIPVPEPEQKYDDKHQFLHND